MDETICLILIECVFISLMISLIKIVEYVQKSRKSQFEIINFSKKDNK